MNKIDRYILSRMLIITLMVLMVLIFIFMIIDFSENSDDFADRGATMSQIWSEYYLNYIPEMVRLVTPVAIFVACLFITGQMTERMEIIALKAAGVSLYRLALPFLFFGGSVAIIVSYLDGFVIPKSNAERIIFENRYLTGKSDRIDRGGIYRQESPETIFHVTYFDPTTNIGLGATFTTFEDGAITRIANAQRIEWIDSTEVWEFNQYKVRDFNESGYTEMIIADLDSTFNILPRDLARRSSDLYQLTYPEAVYYIESIERSGAGGANLPKVQLYGRIAYPISIFVVCLIGFSLASVKRSGGKGFYVAMGLVISFIYLVFMKVIEPFGAAGSIDPLIAAVLPHAVFLVTGIGLLLTTKK